MTTLRGAMLEKANDKEAMKLTLEALRRHNESKKPKAGATKLTCVTGGRKEIEPRRR